MTNSPKQNIFTSNVNMEIGKKKVHKKFSQNCGLLCKLLVSFFVLLKLGLNFLESHFAPPKIIIWYIHKLFPKFIIIS